MTSCWRPRYRVPGRGGTPPMRHGAPCLAGDLSRRHIRGGTQAQNWRRIGWTVDITASIASCGGKSAKRATFGSGTTATDRSRMCFGLTNKATELPTSYLSPQRHGTIHAATAIYAGADGMAGGMLVQMVSIRADPRSRHPAHSQFTRPAERRGEETCVRIVSGAAPKDARRVSPRGQPTPAVAEFVSLRGIRQLAWQPPPRPVDFDRLSTRARATRG